MKFKRAQLVVAAILLWVAGAGTYFAWHESMTTDEGIHTASAYLGLTRGDIRFDTEHPFLFKDLTALPLLFIHPHLPPNDQELWDKAAPTLYDSWGEARSWADNWFYQSGNNAREMIFLARIPGVLVLVGLCFMIYYLGKRWFGEAVGQWALFFTAFNPTLLAHGSLTNTDVPLALAFLLGLWGLWEYWEHPNYKTAAWIGLGIAVTLLTKFSGIAIIPLAIVWVAYTIYRKKVGWPAVLQCLLALVLVWASIWTVYLWHSPFVPQPDGLPQLVVSRVLQLFLPHYTLADFMQVARYILPTPFIKGLFIVLSGTSSGRTTYLLNHVYGNGFWYYFPVVFSLKTQLAGLLLVFVGIGFYLRRFFKPKQWKPIVVLLWLAALDFGSFAIFNKLDLGIRHISPLLVFFSLAIAAVLVRFYKAFPVRHIPLLLAVCYAFPLFLQFHNLIGYANAFVNPYQETYLYFDDSNLDWGQQARDVAHIAQTQFPGQPVSAAFFWNPYALGYYGLPTTPLDPANPPKDGIVIATATQLARDPAYTHFRDVKPAYILDNSTFFYHGADLQK